MRNCALLKRRIRRLFAEEPMVKVAQDPLWNALSVSAETNIIGTS